MFYHAIIRVYILVVVAITLLYSIKIYLLRYFSDKYHFVRFGVIFVVAPANRSRYLSLS